MRLRAELEARSCQICFAPPLLTPALPPAGMMTTSAVVAVSALPSSCVCKNLAPAALLVGFSAPLQRHKPRG